MRWIATLAVAAAAVGFCSAEGPCPPGFVNMGDDPDLKCLAFTDSTGTWHSMLNLCELLGGSLATVTGDLHNKVYWYIRNRPDLHDTCFWIGGSDEDMESHWKWSFDGSDIPQGGPHWDPCEPEPNGGYEENYLAICPELYYYKDYPGGDMHHAICQIFI